MKRWLFILGIYALYLAGVKQMIVLFQRIGVIAIRESIPDDAIIKWASIILLSLIIAIDIVHAIRHKRDFIVSAIGSYLFDRYD